MCFFNKKKKARQLAEQQAKANLAKKEAQKVVVEEKKVEPIQPKTVVEKKVNVEPKVVPKTEEEKKDLKSAKYHVSQNKDPKSDSYRKWRVRKEGSNKTIKFFDTQKQAIEYAESLAETSGSSVVIHKMDGSIRKQDYVKKA